MKIVVEQAAAKGGKLNAGSSGNGTPPHLTLALFNDIAKTDIQHVPYKGGAPSITDLIGGQLDVIFSNFPESIAHVKGGKLKAIALCSATRHAMVPDVPTTAEAGFPGSEYTFWVGMMAPSATPKAIIDHLHAEVVKILNNKDFKNRLDVIGATPMPMTSRRSLTGRGSRCAQEPIAPCR